MSLITPFVIREHKVKDESINEPQVALVKPGLSLYPGFISLGMTSGPPQAFHE